MLAVARSAWDAMTDRQRDAIRHAHPVTVNWGDQGENAIWLDANGDPTIDHRAAVTYAADHPAPFDTDLRTVMADDPTKVPSRTKNERDDAYRTRLRAAYAAEIAAEETRRAGDLDGGR